jgi:cytochrome c oxidase subunit 2
MHTTILWICAALAAVIFAVMLYSVATFRSTPGAGTAAYRHSTIVEVLWALIPIVILVSAAAPAVSGLVSLSEPAAPNQVGGRPHSTGAIRF